MNNLKTLPRDNPTVFQFVSQYVDHPENEKEHILITISGDSDCGCDTGLGLYVFSRYIMYSLVISKKITSYDLFLSKKCVLYQLEAPVLSYFLGNKRP